mmetsp:Transcript_85999/g.230022  ORF Transcript_85999/g.230022 Transcript_85999/m.230022 type:complete len:224 (-) Transcript_85999:3491-4162(-)
MSQPKIGTLSSGVSLGQAHDALGVVVHIHEHLTGSLRCGQLGFQSVTARVSRHPANRRHLGRRELVGAFGTMIAQLRKVSRLITDYTHQPPGLPSCCGEWGKADAASCRNQRGTWRWALSLGGPSVVPRWQANKEITGVGGSLGHLRSCCGRDTRRRLASCKSEDHEVRSSWRINMDTHFRGGSTALGIHGFNADDISVPVVVIARDGVLLRRLRVAFGALCP